MKNIIIPVVTKTISTFLLLFSVQVASAAPYTVNEIRTTARNILKYELPAPMCFWNAEMASNKLARSCIASGSELAGWKIKRIQSQNQFTGTTCHEAVLLTTPDGSQHFYVDTHLKPGFFADVAEMEEISPNFWRPKNNIQDKLTVFKNNFFCFDSLQLPDSLLPWNQDSSELSDLFVEIFQDEWPSNQLLFIPGGLNSNFNFSCPSEPTNDNSGLLDPEDIMCQEPEESSSLPVSTVGSFDPNDKTGTVGNGTLHYVVIDDGIRYSIFFENLETATAAAQEVLVTDQLDANVLDLSTFALGPITFGDKTFVPPSGVKSFTTDVDLRPENNLLVRINAGLNQTTGLITWRFSSIDPVTGLLPEDPLAGFLPPNVTPPEGDGSVLFTINPKEGLLTGTEIRNKADIIFDTNEPIVTPEWLNTIDVDKPVSNVLPLDDTQSDPEFMVYWTGSDIGAGVKDYTIYVSEDGGSFSEWLTHTPETSSTYTGENGKSYAFYSVARDSTNHVEDIPDVPDTTTLLMSNLPPVADAGGPYAVDEGSNDVVSAAASTDPEDELLSYEWDFDYDGITFTVDTSGITPTFSADALDGPATRNIAVRVTDPQGASAIAQSSVAIANVAPVIDNITAPVDPVQTNIAVNVSASFTDSGKSDTHTATVDWGDGNSTTSDATTDNGAGSIAESHSYTASGVYTVTVTITDDDGDSDTQLYQYVVVYDPDSGFVTGGGQIVSPAGAYVVDPTLTGKAVFGFNAKYKKGQSTPSGNSQFQFKTANLHFHSDSYEWLVVAGPQAKFKGVGTINGTGSYGFMISAVDGEVNGGGGVDKFRIKIWDVVTDAVVYDSEMGLADDDAPSTAITKGSIVIHNK